jgi:chaperonin GroEL (HSP60 family)
MCLECESFTEGFYKLISELSLSLQNRVGDGTTTAS